MRTFSLVEFAGLLVGMSAGLHLVRHEALEHIGVVVEAEAKRVIGTYDYGWPPLAESTQDQRASLGFAPDEPLLRTGEMKDSIEHITSDHDVEIGSNNDKAVWQELGTARIPARSFLLGAAYHEHDKILEIIGRSYHGFLASGGKTITKF